MSITKKDLQDALRAQDKRFTKSQDQQTKHLLTTLRTYTDRQTDALASLVKSSTEAAFEQQSRDLHRVFASRAEVAKLEHAVALHERKLKSIERALHVQL